MKHSIIVLFLIGLHASGYGASNDEQFARIVDGSSRQSVQKALGEPHTVTLGAIPVVPYEGPQEGLLEILGPKTKYEEWFYQFNGIDYYIWFGNRDGLPKDKWKVVSKASYPKGAVF